ncbi:MAG: glycosyltransferase family 4 protein [Nitrospinae bacterium]|nr:glycosyltransferase family 4 protein [Nitrospinota bacterium]
MTSRKAKIAFVIQRYGLEVNGGSEKLCRALAEKLVPHYDLDVLSTCAVDHATWANEYPPGLQTLNGVPVRRFPVSLRRDDRRFGSLIGSLFASEPPGGNRADEIEWMRQMGPYSEGLLQYIKENRDRYDLFVFFTYLFATTYFGLPLVRDKALFLPTAHDEAYIRLSIFKEIFSGARGFFFLSPEERALVFRLFENAGKPHEVTGIGIDIPNNIPSPGEFREKHGLRKPYVLYVGRIEEGKGCRELVDFFVRYKIRDRRETQLVLLGKNLVPIPSHPDIRHLGFVSEEDKFAAIGGAEVLVNSSFYESFSIVVMEGWSMGVPALVNGRCEVLAGQCKRSSGGLWYGNFEEFRACLDRLLDQPGLAKRLGQSGRDYVRENFNWETLTRKYRSLIDRFA